MNKTETATTRTYKRTNDIIEDHGDWLLVDISTHKHPDATMAVDTDVFKEHKGRRIGAAHSRGGCGGCIYARYTYNKKTCLFHRDVINAGDLYIDHIDPTTETFVDNRRRNLRAVTHSQNMQNRRKHSNNTSGVPGVRWEKRNEKWRASITINRKKKHLGYFDNIIFAIGARQQAERELFGEYTFGGAE